LNGNHYLESSNRRRKLFFWFDEEAIEFETKSTNQHSNEETTNQQSKKKLWNQEWPKQCLCPRDCIFATPSRLIIE